jgi:CO/xanthine dehydrogenase FAD-binding subunit
MRPRTLDEALRLLDRAHREGVRLRPMAGCTDVLVDAHFGKALPERFLDVWGLRKELGGLRWTEAGLVIGATCTYAEALETPKFVAELPALAKAASQVGARQIQARGTFAGNVENASPAADAAPMLLALDAQVKLASLQGVRTVPLLNYWSGYRQTVRRPDELITAIVVPAAALGSQGQWFRKVGTRAYQAITKVGLASRLQWQGGKLVDVRLAAISMAATPKRCATLETYLKGRELATIDAAELRHAQAVDLQPIDDVRSNATYRAEVFARLVEQALRETHLATAH